MDRREMMKGLGAIGMLGGANEAVAQKYHHATNGLPPLKITDVKRFPAHLMA